MNRIECRITAVLLAAMIGLALLGSAAAADPKNQASQVRAESPAAEAPFLGRVVVTPTPEQLAKLRLERRMIGLENRAAASGQTGSVHRGTTGAL